MCEHSFKLANVSPIFKKEDNLNKVNYRRSAYYHICHHEIMLNNNKITSSNEEKLLGILLDSKLNFESHRGSLCRKEDKKTNALDSLTLKSLGESICPPPPPLCFFSKMCFLERG